MDYYRKIDHVVDSLRNAKENGKKCSLLIGAGCSVTAGIPTANGFVEKIKDRYNACWESATEKTYPKCMYELAPGERKSLIREFVDNAKINWTHLCIAQLIKEGYVDRVLTVNFDLLVSRACSLLGVFPSVYDFAASQAFKPAEISDHAVFYLHGQYTGFVLMNTEKEVEEHSKRLAPVFEDAGRGRTWIVCGYSGDCDPVFDHLANVPCFNDNLYWIGYEKNPPSQHVRQKLLTENKYAFYIQDYDSDRFFITLTQRLNCFPPKIFTAPFSHLKNVFDSFTPFPILTSDLASDRTFDFTSRTKKMISSAIKSIERQTSKKIEKIPLIAKQLKIAEDLYMKGDYKAIIKLKSKIQRDKKGKDLLYWSEILLGNAIHTFGENLKISDKAKFIEEAIIHYKNARIFTSKPNVALFNWGFSLYDLAQIKEDIQEKDSLLKESIKKYEEAVKLKPDDHEALYNWGISLSDLAKIKEDIKEKDSLLKGSIKKYEEAVKLKPDYHEALNNWGISLSDLAKIKEDIKEKDSLLKGSIKKYEEAVKLKPDYHLALNNWGISLYYLAKIKEDIKEKDSLLKGSIKKYEEAVKLKPDDHEALYNWGISLSDLAKIKEDIKEKDSLLKGSIKKYEEAVKLKPDYHLALNNWGISLSDLAKINENIKEKEKLFKEALELYNKAEQIKKGSGSYNLACIYSLLNDIAKSRQFLLRTKEFNELPTCDHMKTDTDLDNVRNEEWFKEFMKENCGKINNKL